MNKTGLFDADDGHPDHPNSRPDDSAPSTYMRDTWTEPRDVPKAWRIPEYDNDEDTSKLGLREATAAAAAAEASADAKKTPSKRKVRKVSFQNGGSRKNKKRTKKHKKRGKKTRRHRSKRYKH